MPLFRECGCTADRSWGQFWTPPREETNLRHGHSDSFAGRCGGVVPRQQDWRPARFLGYRLRRIKELLRCAPRAGRKSLRASISHLRTEAAARVPKGKSWWPRHLTWNDESLTPDRRACIATPHGRDLEHTHTHTHARSTAPSTPQMARLSRSRMQRL